MRSNFVLLFLCTFLLAFSGRELIGSLAPDWNNKEWLNSKPLTLSALKGNVIFIRFFMESNCPMCSASAPYLNDFYSRYKDQGLVVIGMYTPKPYPRKTEIKTVQGFVEDYKFRFPVALDNDWATLKKFWLDRVPNADYTSVSFLIDRKGIIRYIHPGGTYSSQDAIQIKEQMEDLLRER